MNTPRYYDTRALVKKTGLGYSTVSRMLRDLYPQRPYKTWFRCDKGEFEQLADKMNEAAKASPIRPRRAFKKAL